MIKKVCKYRRKNAVTVPLWFSPPEGWISSTASLQLEFCCGREDKVAGSQICLFSELCVIWSERSPFDASGCYGRTWH